MPERDGAPEGRAQRKITLEDGPLEATRPLGPLPGPEPEPGAPEETAPEEGPGRESEAEGAGPAEAPQAPSRAKALRAAALAAAAVAVAAAAAAGAYALGSSQAPAQPRSIDTPADARGADEGGAAEEAQEAPSAELPAAQACEEHSWEPVDAEEEEIPEKTEEVEVAATYETVTAYRTLCNVCHERIDGKVAEHRAKTGHAGATAGVPVQERRVKEAAHTEKKVVEPAKKVLTWTKEKCSKCGEVRAVEERTKEIEGAEGAE